MSLVHEQTLAGEGVPLPDGVVGRARDHDGVRLNTASHVLLVVLVLVVLGERKSNIGDTIENLLKERIYITGKKDAE